MRPFVVSACVLAGFACVGDTLGATSARQVIKVISVSTSYAEHRHPPSGPVGDTATMKDKLVNAAPQFGRAKNAVVGSDSAKATFTRGGGMRLCGVARFPTGTIRICGAARAAQGGYSLPVVGGTGAFANAQGSVFVTGSDKRSLNVYDLTFGLPA
jgi:dirigent-like protein